MKIFEVFSNIHQKKLLQDNQLPDFPSIWGLKAEWFEEPNIRRGGWSGVVKHVLQSADGSVEVFIKRQAGHVSRTFLHPIRGISTLKKEYASIKRLQSCNVPTLEPIYFAHTDNNAGNKAVLITLGLSTHVSLDEIDPAALLPADKNSLITAVAIVVRIMHRHNLQHNCLYPKHIFVKQMSASWDVRIIDLEKMKRTLLQRSAVRRDLSTLFRHAGKGWNTKDALFFLRCYCEEDILSDAAKKLWYDVAVDVRRKKSRQ